MENNTTLENIMPVMLEVLESGGSFTFSPHGSSMLPLIKSGKTPIVLKKIDVSLKKGDVPLFKRKDGTFVLHRIMIADEKGYIVVGDNEFIAEGYFEADAAYGLMCGYYAGKKLVSVDSVRYKLYVKVILPVWRFHNRVKRKLKIGKNK